MFRLAGLMLACTVAVWAHHSFSAEFDSSKPIHLAGKVSHLEWTNPHALIWVSVGTTAGGTAEWMVEAAAPNAMMRRGLTKGDLKAGTTIAVDGEQARDGSNRMNGEFVTLADGRRVSLRNEGKSEPEGKSEKDSI